jgi:hypothetical protein
MGEVRGPTIVYGLCRGGPFSLRQLAHHEREHVVWRDPDTKKAIPGLVGPSMKHPGAIPGCYVWDDSRKEWNWEEGD